MKDILNKIQAKGYWKINIYPIIFIKNRISSLAECEKIVQKAVVELRGWPYPLFHYRVKIGRGQDWIQVAEDMQDEIEVWRFYQSGQFIQYLALREDLMDLEKIRNRVISIPGQDTKKPVLSFEYTVCLLTEIFEFLSRLAKQGIYKDGVIIKVELINTKGRRLCIFNSGRGPFLKEYKTDDSNLLYDPQNLTEKEAIDNSKESAISAFLWFVERFGWNNPNIIAAKDIQRELFQRDI